MHPVKMCMMVKKLILLHEFLQINDENLKKSPGTKVLNCEYFFLTQLLELLLFKAVSHFDNQRQGCESASGFGVHRVYAVAGTKKVATDENILQVHKTGPNIGLEMDLDTLIYSYLDITSSAGIRVVVHSPYEDPNPSENGFNISPGDRCVEYKATNASDLASACQFSCIRECIQQTSQEICGLRGSFHSSRLPGNLKSNTQMSCLDDVLEHMDESGLPCECPFPCMSTAYDFKMSTSALDIPTTFTGSSSLGWTEDPRCDLYRDLNLGSKKPF
ncbi:FMRFamide-activated amiloride-sensitive sodium channel [Caerostris extrusa]|uniref:FMRFamide-activated amiloride-sensitive sodium channel n=1 Tax=Caerostris extrusa TaxID=172846 RepID=A0AAV4X4A0_CAEEX|nr:FMRFamide-activated amiloride-sensitive sodium channel [Caerostris extrusa]